MQQSMLLAAQGLKVFAGCAQFVFGLWLLSRRSLSALPAAFAIAFGSNGIAYVFFNLAMPGQRTAGSMAVGGRAAFNWIATAAMLAFAVLLARGARSQMAALSGGVIAGMVLCADLLATRQFNLFQFGGIAIYPATALVLGMLPIISTDHDAPLAQGSTWVGAALAINAVDHLGAELMAPASAISVWLQIAAMAIVLCFWIIASITRKELRGWPILLVIACMVLPFLLGMLVREVAGSYVGVQRSGFIGFGRLVATALLTYATASGKLFRGNSQQWQQASASGS